MKTRNLMADYLLTYSPKWNWMCTLRCWLRSGSFLYNAVLFTTGKPGVIIHEKTFFRGMFETYYSTHEATIGMNGTCEIFCRDSRLNPINYK